jgi:hypothetical protein
MNALAGRKLTVLDLKSSRLSPRAPFGSHTQASAEVAAWNAKREAIWHQKQTEKAEAWRRRRDQVNKLLADSPLAFSNPPRPLKVGIHEDLRALGHPRRAVALMLREWTTRRAYQTALIPGAPRFGLDGTVAGEVTEAELPEHDTVGLEDPI